MLRLMRENYERGLYEGEELSILAEGQRPERKT